MNSILNNFKIVAVSIKNCNNCEIGIPTSDGDSLLSNIIKAILFLIGMLAVGALIACGYKFLTANGDPKAIANAKRGIIYSIAGLVIAAAAYGIVQMLLDGAAGKGLSLLGVYYG